MCAGLDEDHPVDDDHDRHHLDDTGRRHADGPVDEDAKHGANDRAPVEPPIPGRETCVDLVRDDDIGERFEEPPRDGGDQDADRIGGEAAGQHVTGRQH